MNKIEELKKQIEQEKQNILNSAPVKINDYVEYICEKTGKPKQGYVSYMYVKDKDLSLQIKVNFKVDFMPGWSSTYHYLTEKELESIKIIDNPVDLKKLERLQDMIDEKEYEIEKAIRLLKQQKERLEKYYECEQNKCIHKWKQISYEPVKVEPATTWEPEKEWHEYECEICGKIIESY